MPPAITHALWPYTPEGRLVRAVCGVLIQRVDAVLVPTCPACREALARYENYFIAFGGSEP